jgi:hypothetical protein
MLKNIEIPFLQFSTENSPKNTPNLTKKTIFEFN